MCDGWQVDVLKLMVEYLGHSNDAAEDDDRGRADDSIALVLKEDGSGHVAIGRNVMFEFDSLAEFQAVAEQLFS